MGRTRAWVVCVGLMATTPGCNLGEKSIGRLDVMGGSDTSSGPGMSSGLDTSAGTDTSSGDSTATPEACVEDFEISGSVTFSIDPGPDGVGILYVRATAQTCMLGPSLALWASPGVIVVREDVLNSESMRVDFELPSIPCAPDGTPSTVSIAAFLNEGGHTDPMDPTPRLGDMVNTLNGEGDVEGGYFCIEVGPGTSSITYDIDEFWFNTLK